MVANFEAYLKGIVHNLAQAGTKVEVRLEEQNFVVN